MSAALRGISSMATRAMLAALVDVYRASTDIAVQIDAVGGVDAARRVRAGEAFDLVVLASDAIDDLMRGGHLQPGSRIDLVHSGVAVAVREGAARPDLGSPQAVRSALLAAARIGYSTGPSGVRLLALLTDWGVMEALQGRLIQAPAGVPVAALLARGEVELGFQQLSEMLHQPGISVLGPLPPEIQINTTFSGAVGAQAAQPAAAGDLLAFLASPAAQAAKQAHGMLPA